MAFSNANRFVPVETVTNVPGFFGGFIQVTRQTKHTFFAQDALKSGGAPPHSKTWPPFTRPEISLASWSAAVRRRSWVVGSLLLDIIVAKADHIGLACCVRVS